MCQGAQQRRSNASRKEHAARSEVRGSWQVSRQVKQAGRKAPELDKRTVQRQRNQELIAARVICSGWGSRSFSRPGLT